MDRHDVDKEYYAIINLARHKALRIREFCAKLKPFLSEEDYYFKMSFDDELKAKGLDWLNYGSRWNLWAPDLKAKIKTGMSKKDLLDPENFVIKVKATNILITENKTA